MKPLERYADFLARHPVPVLVAVALATVGMVAGMRRLETRFDVEQSLPSNHPFVEIDRAIRKQFGGRNSVIVAIVPRSGDVWRPEVLDVVQGATLEALRLDQVIAQNVVSLAAPSVRWVEDKGSRIDTDYLMREVPRTPEAIAALRAKVESDPQLRGMLVTPDQRAALLVVDFWETGEPSIEIAHRVMKLSDVAKDRDVDLYFAGEPIVALTDVEQSDEVSRRIPLAFGVIALMLLASFRNLQGMVIPMLTAALSTVWGLGLMGWTGQVIDAWNVATPILLIAIAAGHSAQMLKRYTEEVERLGDNRAAVVASTAAVGPVMVAAGGVATLGFASLALTGIPAIRAFGLACAYGIGSAVVLEMTFIPALRALLPAPRMKAPGDGPTSRLLDALERAIVENGGRKVLIGSAIAAILSVLGAMRLRTYGPTLEYMAKGGIPRTHLEKILEHFPGTTTMTVLYEGRPGDAKSVALLENMDGLRGELEKNPIVVKTNSLVDLVKMLHKTFAADAPVPYSLPHDQELVAQLLFLGDSPAFERFTDRTQSKALLVAYLSSDDSALVGPLVRDAQAWVAAHPPPDGVKVLVAGGSGPTVLAVNEHTTRSKMVNLLIVLATIWAVSSLMMRSPAGGLYVILPILATLLALFGLLGWTGVRLDMGSATTLAMAAGVGADYAIYFLYRLREERARAASDREALHVTMRTSGRAVIFVAASIAAGFGVMGLSKFFGLRLFGSVMPAAMVISCLAALSIMPVLVMRARPRFIFGERPA